MITIGFLDAAADVFGIAVLRTGPRLALDLDFVFVDDLEFLAMTVTPYNLLAAIDPSSDCYPKAGKKGI